MAIGLSPVQQRYLDRLGALVSRTTETGRGEVVFLAGGPGSGRSFWVDAVSHALSGGRVVAGRLTESGYAPLATGSSGRLSPEVESLLASVAGSGALLGPVFALIGQLVSVSVAAYGVVDSVRDQKDHMEVHQLVPGLLRTVAAENPHRPLVCLIDDADLADGNWWVNLMLSFAQEVEQGLPLVLVMCFEGPGDLSDAPGGEESSACAVARSLVQRGLAEYWPLVALSREQIRSWIGPASNELLSALWAITEGNPGEIPDLWARWVRRRSIERDANDRWQIIGDVERTLAEAGDRFTAQLGALLGDNQIQLLSDVRQILACAALEGRTFTAEAVARALGWNRDLLIDLLDDHLTGATEPLREAQPIEILTPELTTHTLWRYAFHRDLDRRIARTRFASGAERKSLAQRLAPALIETYAPEEHRVAATLAVIFVEAGDPNAATHFRRVANLGVDQSMLRGQARYLLTAKTQDWTTSDLSRTAEFLLHATNVLADVDPYSDSLALATACARFAERANGRLLEAQAIYWEAELRMRIGLLEPARRDVMRADAIIGEPAAAWLEARSALLLSQIELACGNLKAGRAETVRYRELEQKLGDLSGEAVALHQIGQIEVRMGNFEAARAPTVQALKIYEQYGDRRGEAAALTEIALIDIRLGTFEEARSLGQRALKICQEIGDRAGEATNLFQLGLMERMLQRFDTARSVTQRAIAIFQEIGNRANEAENWLQLGQIELSSGDIDAARAPIERAVRCAEAASSRACETRSRLQLSELELMLGNPREAQALAQYALRLAEEMGDRRIEATGLRLLASVETALGNTKAARSMLNRARHISRELVS